MADIHQCSLLARRHVYLMLSADGRWVLQGQKHIEVIDVGSDDVVLQLILFCPMCGFDCRRDTTWAPKDPELRRELAEALKQ